MRRFAFAILAALLLPGVANAQETGSRTRSRVAAPAPARPALTGDPIKDIGNAINPGAPGSSGTPDLMNLWNKLVAADIQPDLKYASALAGAANTSSSKVRKQCLDAIIALNDQASGANLKNADGTPMAKPDKHVVTDIEQLAEVVDNLAPTGPLFTSCAGAAELAKASTLAFVNAIVTGVAASAVAIP